MIRSNNLESKAMVLIMDSTHKLSVLVIDFDNNTVDTTKLSNPVPNLSNFLATSTNKYAVWFEGA